ncbi:hypothetical protein L596_015319 [Steinernema carpocapsae]|uniref:Saposin B-type domain-containing protein n=1 Tax=Steinernema carpocapsae TaxID=34508 RepID=A0A4U5NFM5_STECR|nr:hypothetical protein L596_015319 [Steinernema carpocapsae]
MKLFVCLFLIAFLALTSATDAPKDPFGPFRKAVCNACVDLVTKAEAGAVNVAKWIKDHTQEVCNRPAHILVKQVCELILTDFSVDLEKLIEKETSPKEACEAIKLC